MILLDEIEKAHPEAFNMLLQIMEDGNLTDAKGRKVDFRNTIIIMTSNVGAELIQARHEPRLRDRRRRGEDRRRANTTTMKDKVLDELKKTFRPEFLNRIDAIDRLPLADATSRSARSSICSEARARRSSRSRTSSSKSPTRRWTCWPSAATTRNYGARPLRRIIQNLIEDPLAEGLLDARFVPGKRSASMSRMTSSASARKTAKPPRKRANSPPPARSRKHQA